VELGSEFNFSLNPPESRNRSAEVAAAAGLDRSTRCADSLCTAFF
jgi:hypothetical protein